MAVTQTLYLVFRTEYGRVFRLAIDNPKDDLTADQVSAAMDTIIAKNIFVTSSGALAAKEYAQIVDRETNMIYEA